MVFSKTLPSGFDLSHRCLACELQPPRADRRDQEALETRVDTASGHGRPGWKVKLGRWLGRRV